MSNESSTPSPDPAAPPPVAAPPVAPPPRRTSRIKRFFLWWIAGIVAALVIWTLVALNWSYSAGDRGGLLQKFERKGWLCKKIGRAHV